MRIELSHAVEGDTALSVVPVPGEKFQVPLVLLMFHSRTTGAFYWRESVFTFTLHEAKLLTGELLAALADLSNGDPDLIDVPF